MLALAFVLALAAADPASAPEATPAPAVVPSPAVAVPVVEDEARVICVMEEQMGSHFKKKTCLTKAQWKKKRERDHGVAERALTPETSSERPF